MAPKVPFEVSSLLHSGYQHALTRKWQTGTELTKSNLMFPVFIHDKPNEKEPIASLPGQFRFQNINEAWDQHPPGNI